jgi:hypothetical protein
MTPLLRDLIWAICIVLAAWLGMNLLDENAKLSAELTQVRKVVERDTRQAQAVNWDQVDQQSRQAQREWLALLPAVESTGKFRAESMESLSDLCQSVQAVCRISSRGEIADANILAAQLAVGSTTTKTQAISNTTLEGLVVAQSKLSVPLQPGILLKVMPSLERGSSLRTVEKLTIRGVAIDMEIKSYGLQSNNKTNYQQWIDRSPVVNAKASASQRKESAP